MSCLVPIPRCSIDGCKAPIGYNPHGLCFRHNSRRAYAAKHYTPGSPEEDLDLETGLPDPPTEAEIRAIAAAIRRQRPRQRRRFERLPHTITEAASCSS